MTGGLRSHAYIAAALLVVAAGSRLAAQVPAPESHFGFRMGTDDRLAGAEDIERYFEIVAAQSDRVEVVDIGATTEGHRTIAAIISAPANIDRLPEIRIANQRLSDPRMLSPEEARRLVSTHKAVLAIGCSIHAAEIGATQAASELLYSLATSTDPETLHVLENVVVILIPSLNPDGHRLVLDWLRRTKNTGVEGAPMPWLYHKYAGHDLNRDAFMMNMAESRNLARFFYTEWHPQVFLSMHEMTSDGPRMFVPPMADPINPNYDPLIWREAALLGGTMALQLQRDGRRGVVSSALYDYFWPGYEDSAPLGHNTVCLLAEVASANRRTSELPPGSEARPDRGAPAGVPQVNYPDPWPGGRWTLRHVIDYDLSAVKGLLHGVAAFHEDIVENFYEMGRRAVALGERGGPFAFVIPPEQRDPYAAATLEELLLLGGIEIHRSLAPFTGGGTSYPAGSDIVLLAQPYRAYAKTLLERQAYPSRATARETAERPYDAAGWTLPAQMGVDVQEIDRPFRLPAMSQLAAAAIRPAQVSNDPRAAFYVVDARGNGGAIAINRLIAARVTTFWLSAPVEAGGRQYGVGSVVVENSPTARAIIERIGADLGLSADGLPRKPTAGITAVELPRIGLYKSWVENSDEGWTRWLLERYGFQFTSVTDRDVRAGDLRARYDVIILPSAPAEQMVSGHGPDTTLPEYAGGLGIAGTSALEAFVEAGGTLVCLDQACGLAIELFDLPVRDVARDASAAEFFCPGSILRIDLHATEPLAYGMPPQTAGFFGFSSAFEIDDAGGGSGRATGITVIAQYGAKDLLVSGWLEGERVIAGRPAALTAAVGSGRVVLIGFPAQHRAQSHATFRLLFNSIFTTPRAAIARQ